MGSRRGEVAAGWRCKKHGWVMRRAKGERARGQAHKRITGQVGKMRILLVNAASYSHLGKGSLLACRLATKC